MNFYDYEEETHIEPKRTNSEVVFAGFWFVACVASIAAVVLDAAGHLNF